MKFTQAATVIGAAAVLVGGGAVAVNAATSGSDPVTLCSNSLLKIVSTPNSSGRCPGGSTTIKVASTDAVDALEARVDAQSATNSDLQSRLSAAENELAQLPNRFPADFTATGHRIAGTAAWLTTFNGARLQPGAEVNIGTDPGTGDVLAHVDSSGNLNDVSAGAGGILKCSTLPQVFTTTTAWGDPISATVDSLPGCP